MRSIGRGVREYDAEKIFGFKKDKVTGERIKLHKKELYDHCFSANVFLVIE